MNSDTKKTTLLRLGLFFQDCLNRFEDTESDTVNIDLRNEVNLAVDLITTGYRDNGWFTKDSVLGVYTAWANALNETNIDQWLQGYDFSTGKSKKVGVIMAGNLPLVGLHDALSVIISGHVLHAKLSSKDKSLMLLLLNVLKKIAPDDNCIKIVEQLKDIDALIATGSDNSARYFEYYFKDKQRIIRKNRTSIAVLNGNENSDELNGLSHDIFQHFGLGCRNVTKLYLPRGFDLDIVFKALFHYKEIGFHNKYANNYDYNKAIYLLNQEELIENGFLLMKEDKGLHSPVGVLFYEFYDTLEEIHGIIEEQKDSLQCVVTNEELPQKVAFGKAQNPELWDYADGIDTIEFLLK